MRRLGIDGRVLVGPGRLVLLAEGGLVDVSADGFDIGWGEGGIGVPGGKAEVIADRVRQVVEGGIGVGIDDEVGRRRIRRRHGVDDDLGADRETVPLVERQVGRELQAIRQRVDGGGVRAGDRRRDADDLGGTAGRVRVGRAQVGLAREGGDAESAVVRGGRGAQRFAAPTRTRGVLDGRGVEFCGWLCGVR
ncbi:hypothetical protein [Nocardia thailandica]|uniref:hypothetical protein n=1 Tax=Nocardia thailandica TaxID=257275 RepID=UPI0012F923D6|nr:hypothetical protein [Nocardia thailandica]